MFETRARLNPLLLVSAIALFSGACSGSDDDGRTKPPPAGNIVISFTANETMVAAGGRVTLTWAITGVTAATVSITATPGSAVVQDSAQLSGSMMSAAINEATTFKLVATSGTETKEATVSVGIDANGITINSFTAAPNPAPLGGNALLAWSIAGATQVRIVEDGNELLNTTTDVANGTLSVPVDNPTHTFRLEAQNASTTAQATVTVTTEQPAAIRFFRVTPPTFNGASVDATVTWTAQGTAIGLTANGTAVANFPGTETGTISVTVSETTVFQLSASGAGSSLNAMRVVARAQGEIEPNNDAATATPLTESAVSGEISDDMDVDYFSFTVPANGNVFMQVNDEAGDCSDAIDVALVDTDGMTSLGTTRLNDGCYSITPSLQSFAANLPAGTYYASVEPFLDVGPYTLVVLVNGAACGNQIVEASTGEQCDDGNTTDGDGCSATCQVAPTGTVSGVGQDQIFAGAINPATRQDFYEVVLPTPGNIFAETGVPTIGVCEGTGMNDTVLYLLDANFDEVGGNDDGGPSLCSSIDPNFDDFAKELAAGTYYVRVQSYGTSLIPAYELRIRTTAPMGCGNGIQEMGELCDDFNVMNGDGCSSTCMIETAGSLNASGSVSVTLGGPMDSPRFVEIVISQAGSTITATTTDGSGGCPFGTDIGLFSAALDAEYGVAFGEGGCAGFGPPEDTFSTNLSPGSYLIGLVSSTGTGGAVTLEVTISAPACANGILETTAGEQCDDGNTTANDGCDASCRVEGVGAFEVEPNNDIATATALGATRSGPTVTIGGNISPVGDHDFYSFVIPTGQTGSVQAATYGMLGDTSVCGFDSVMTLYDAQMVELESNDDSNGELCSTFDATTTGATALPAGTYYIDVQRYSDSQTIIGYFLDVTIVP